jgi:hypothetical protein
MLRANQLSRFRWPREPGRDLQLSQFSRLLTIAAGKPCASGLKAAPSSIKITLAGTRLVIPV